MRTAGPYRGKAQRRSRRLVGTRAEEAVVDFLAARGFSIWGTNVRLGPLELDIVARRGDLLAVVEVRTRGAGSFEKPFASIGPEKQRRLVRAVERLWREQANALEGIERIRIDVAAVTFAPTGRGTFRTDIEYAAGAVDASSV